MQFVTGVMLVACVCVHVCVKVVWQYSNLSCSVYPLSSIDSIGDDGRTGRCAIWRLAFVDFLCVSYVFTMRYKLNAYLNTYIASFTISIAHHNPLVSLLCYAWTWSKRLNIIKRVY